MRISIRTKLFVTMSLLVLLFVLLSLSSTLVGLEKYYIEQKKDILLAAVRQIDDIYQGEPDAISLELERIGSRLGAGILITDDTGSFIYSSMFPIKKQRTQAAADSDKDHDDKRPKSSPGPQRPQPLIKSQQTIDSDTTIKTLQEMDLKIDFIVIEHKLENGDMLLIRQPLAPIAESASTAAKFIIFTGLISLTIASIAAFFLAKNFTFPILQLNRIAQGMSRLDFSQTCRTDRSDEIGELAQNLNHVSAQLDSAITELNIKNQQLLADVEKERRLDKMRKEFVSNVSHELKTPLSLIQGYTEGLRENVAHDEEKKNLYCSIIIDEAEKMDKLVKDLLNLSQFDSGFFQLSCETFDISVLAADIALKFQHIVTAKELSLTVNVPSPCLVHADMLRIEQVFINLLNNASNHAAAHSTITLSAKKHEQYLRIFVRNIGQPIPADSLDKIWTSFYKVDKARTREYGGHGLGLSIVRAIQELHGCQYGVSNTDDGVVFWFDIQAA